MQRARQREMEMYSLFILKRWAALFTNWTCWLWFSYYARMLHTGLSVWHSSNGSLNVHVNVNMYRGRGSGNWTANILDRKILRHHQLKELSAHRQRGEGRILIWEVPTGHLCITRASTFLLTVITEDRNHDFTFQLLSLLNMAIWKL